MTVDHTARQVTARDHGGEVTSSNPNSAHSCEKATKSSNGLDWGQNDASETGLRTHWASWTILGQAHIHETNFFISFYWPPIFLPSAEMFL